MCVGRIYRLLRLIILLQTGRGFNVDELARELEVSRRTVFRDLNVLELAHIPYYFDRERQAYRINSHFFLPPVNLTLTEALSLLMLAVRRRTTTALPWSSHAAKAALKLEGALPSSVREHLGGMMENLQFRLAPSARQQGLDDMLDRLLAAAAARKVCRLVYVSFYDRKQLRLTVHPLRLVFVERAWYLLAWSPQHRQIRTFKLGRIGKLTVLEQTFEPPEQALVDGHFGDAWRMIPEGTLYDVHLLFDRQVAGNVAEVCWHRSQRMSWRDDGTLDFHVRVDGLGEIGWWVLGYGDKVRVLGPPQLAQRVREVARRMWRQYGGGGEQRP